MLNSDIILKEKDNLSSIILHVNSSIKNGEWINTFNNTLKKPRDFEIIFRGEENLYKTALTPKLFRKNFSSNHQEIEIIDEFKRQHPEYSQTCQNIFDWLSVMQHYGIPTRLLDWTTNLLVGLYFATEPSRTKKDGALYFMPFSRPDTINLNISKFNFIDSLIRASDKNSVEETYLSNSNIFRIYEKDYFIYKPHYNNQRIKNQSAAFTVSCAKTVIDENSQRIKEMVSPYYSFIADDSFSKKIFERMKLFICSKSYFDKENLINEIGNKGKYINLVMVVDNNNGINIYIEKIGFLENMSEIKLKFINDICNSKPKKNEMCEFPELQYILPSIFSVQNPITMTKILNLLEEKNFFNLSEIHFFPKIIIPYKNKSKIRDELQMIGINHSFIFPEPTNFYKGFLEKKYFL